MGHLDNQTHDQCYFVRHMTSYATLPYLATCSDHPGWVCAVGGVVKVEQSIQRVSNGPGGATRNANAVAE